MAKYILIQRPNDTFMYVRSKLTSATENELTDYEKVINELCEDRAFLYGR